MVEATCEVTTCKHRDEDGECLLDEIRIVTPYYAFPAPAVCEGYEEEKDGEDV